MSNPSPRTSKLAILGATLILGGARTAAADVPPPPDFVETCTVAIAEEQGGGHCERVDTFHGGVAPETDSALRARGLAPHCGGGGATVGFAVYCGASGAPPTTVPPPVTTVPPPSAPTATTTATTTATPPESHAGCSATPSSSSAPLGLALLLGLAILGHRARR